MVVQKNMECTLGRYILPSCWYDSRAQEPALQSQPNSATSQEWLIQLLLQDAQARIHKDIEEGALCIPLRFGMCCLAPAASSSSRRVDSWQTAWTSGDLHCGWVHHPLLLLSQLLVGNSTLPEGLLLCWIHR